MMQSVKHVRPSQPFDHVVFFLRLGTHISDFMYRSPLFHVLIVISTDYVLMYIY